MQHKAEIEKLLSRLHFFTPEEKRHILTSLRGLPESAAEEFLGLLTKAIEEQDAMLKKVITLHPDFPKKLADFLRKEARALAGRHEQSLQEHTSHILDTP